MISDRKKAIANCFGKRATYYAAQAELQKNISEKLCAFLPVLDNPDILEFGCGSGFLTRRMAQKYPGAKMTITDLSHAMAAACEKNNTGPDRIFHAMDAENPDLGTQRFDLIAGSMAAQWFETPTQSLLNLKSLLKPNGNLYYTALGPDSFPEWRDTLHALGLPSGLLQPSGLPGIFHEDHITATPESTLSFLKAMKNIGASHPKENYTALPPGALKKACAQHDKTYKGRFTWHILYGRLP